MNDKSNSKNNDNSLANELDELITSTWNYNPTDEDIELEKGLMSCASDLDLPIEEQIAIEREMDEAEEEYLKEKKRSHLKVIK